MKKILLNLFAILFLVSCSNDDTLADLNLNEEFVEVGFNLTGDFLDIEEKPMTRDLVRDPKTYYYIKIKDYAVEEEYGGSMIDVGHVGFFSDLKYARLRLKRNHDYKVEATALIESETNIDQEKNSIVSIYGPHGTEHHSINIFNCFSDYLMQQDIIGASISGAVEIPTYKDQSIDRFYNSKDVIVTSNESIELNLKRFSYKLKLELDPPVDGFIEISCVSPTFKHRAYTNESHTSISHIYSLDGKDILTATKNITVKLEKFSSDGISESVKTKDITVKPNVETTLRVNFDKISANNSFNISLDNTPMVKDEIIWN